MCERTFSGALGPYFAQIKEIAAGGNGRILSAIDTRFDFPVCIKRISVANKDECRAALREIRIRRRLRHENIVGLLNAVVLDGTEVSEITPANFRETSCIFLVQELLDADLRQVIESQTRLSDDYVKLFFYQLLRGMKYIHSANVLHRDLKPSNVMINVNSLQLMIGDFGHSMVLDPKYSHGNTVTVCETSLWYKAPELILKTAQYSTASDIWAIGCVLAEMLLGRPLFEGENDLEQLELIIHAINVPVKDQTYVRSCLTDEVNNMYCGKPKFPLQTKLQKVDFQALHLLEHLLAFDPEDRVTIELALSHPFLSEYACVADEPVCLKPLHLEHEVDDFLEYTLKDLVVGECVSLAEEQPRIHLQMSSYSSLNDMSKDSHVSPSESISHSVEERRSSGELKSLSDDHPEDLPNESECSRFKVLEVLKEEHGSSSDSNGVATHEEGVSESPMVLDHSMFNSCKWEKEARHKSLGHRRHHHHRRKKKHHVKSPSSETEPSLDCSNARVPEVRVSEANGMHVPTSNTPIEHSPGVVPPEATVIQEQDDKVHELIMRSRQLIADQNTVTTEVPAITDICCSLTTNTSPTDVCSSLPCKSSMTCDSLSTNACCSAVSSNPAAPELPEVVLNPVLPMETEENHENLSLSVGDLRILTPSTVDLGVAEVIRRSQELLGDVCKPSTAEDDPVKDVIAGSEQLLKPSEDTAEQSPCVSEEKNFAADEIDPVQELIARSEQLLKSEAMGKLDVAKCEERNSMHASDFVKELISKSEELLTCSENTQRAAHPVRKLGVVEHCKARDNCYNHPPPFTEKFEDLTIQSPPLNHLPANNFHIHSNAREDASWGNTMNQSQPLLNDPQHRKASDTRLQELLEESRTLVSNLKTAQSPLVEPESTLEPQEESGRVPCEEKWETFRAKRRSEKGNFHEGLNGIDLSEMKEVLDQAKKLLGKSDELCAKDSSEVDEPVDAMEVDMLVKDVPTERQNITEDVVKDFSHFQNQLDVVPAESLATNERATVYDVSLTPAPMQQTTRLNCLTSSKDSTTVSGGCRFTNTRKQDLVKKRSHETVSETGSDNAHKNFKNSSVTPPDVNLLTAALHTDSSDSKYKTDFKNEVDLKPGKNSSKHEMVARRNTDPYVIEHISSDEVVNRLCGNTCRLESNTNRLNSKDSAGLQNFYAALKIQSIMRNKTRPRRDKRHDTYPF